MADPRWEDDLPREKEAIRSEIESLTFELTSAALDGKTSTRTVENADGTHTMHLDPQADRLLRLQRQLFRAEFGREPESNDPVFWERGRDGQPSRIDVDQLHVELARAARRQGIAPEKVYALSVIGLPMTEALAEQRPALARWWNACIAHYKRCVGAKYTPIAPSELIKTFEAMNFAASHPLIDYEAAEEVDRRIPEPHRRVFGAVLDALKDRDVAEIAIMRASILGTTIKPDSPRGYSERMIYAAATAKVKSRRFDKKSFGAQLVEYDRYEKT